MRYPHRRVTMRDHGVTGVEYAMVICFVSLLLVAGAVTLGGAFSTWANGITDQLGVLLG